MVNLVQTIHHLSPTGGEVLQLPVAVLHHVTWPTYQALFADMGEHRSARLAYDRGTLEIKLSSKLHELINRLLERIITTLTEELGMNVLSLGATTFNAEELAQGVEPDSCFYMQNADRINPEDNSPPQDCPPDLVVKVDINSSSRSRLNIYKSMVCQKSGVIIVKVWQFCSCITENILSVNIVQTLG